MLHYKPYAIVTTNENVYERMKGLTCQGGHRHERVEGASTNASGTYSPEMIAHIMSALTWEKTYADRGSSCSEYTTDESRDCEYFRRHMHGPRAVSSNTLSESECSMTMSAGRLDDTGGDTDFSSSDSPSCHKGSSGTDLDGSAITRINDSYGGVCESENLSLIHISEPTRPY